MKKITMLSTGHKLEFEIGQLVYLRTDNEQHQRIITAIKLLPNNTCIYEVSFGTQGTWHYSIELDTEKDIIKSI